MAGTQEGSQSFFGALGAKIADVARNAPGETFLPGHPITDVELAILQNPGYPVALPSQPVAAYAQTRGVLTLDDADREMHGYIKYIKEEDPEQVARLRSLLSKDVPIYLKISEIDGISATGMLLAMQNMSDPPTPDEIVRQALGLDLYVAAQVEFGKRFMEAQHGAGTMP